MSTKDVATSVCAGWQSEGELKMLKRNAQAWWRLPQEGQAAEPRKWKAGRCAASFHPMAAYVAELNITFHFGGRLVLGDETSGEEKRLEQDEI